MSTIPLCLLFFIVSCNHAWWLPGKVHWAFVLFILSVSHIATFFTPLKLDRSEECPMLRIDVQYPHIHVWKVKLGYYFEWMLDEPTTEKEMEKKKSEGGQLWRFFTITPMFTRIGLFFGSIYYMWSEIELNKVRREEKYQYLSFFFFFSVLHVLSLPLFFVWRAPHTTLLLFTVL